MSLAAGARLGAYEILSHIGSGGMGDVYRARDSKLGRDVALKVLPDTFTADPERVARFRREAQVLASLNHTHIAAIYGLEQANDSQFLVLELVDGENLASRLARGALPTDEALSNARQVAEALEAAHERGIIHRDLKPANIALTTEGQVKVLDFGLAKAIEGPGGPGGSDGLSHSPTLTFAGTQMGVILGTAAYMSPEQAKGRAADKRSDVWAFGCVLYEMLTGRRAYEGEDVSDTLAAVLRGEPEWTALPRDLSPTIQMLLRKSLEKDRRKRIGDISTALFLLDHPLTAPAIPTAPVVLAPAWSRWTWMLGAAAAAIVAGVLGALAAWNAKPAPSPIVTRFPVSLGEGQQFTNVAGQYIAVSPDGTKIVYAANRRLYLRSMSEPEARPIPGTEINPRNPTFAPDGGSIAFTAEDQSLKRIAPTGGALVTITSGIDAAPFGMLWSGDVILYGNSSQTNRGIMRVPATGGTPELIAQVEPNQFAHGPQMLPGGEHLLFTLSEGNTNTAWDQAQVVVQSLRTGQRRTIIEGGSDGRYLPTGHIVYALGHVLLAVRFDERKLQVIGGPVPVLEGVRRVGAAGSGSAQFSVANNGSLVYVPGPASVAVNRMLALVDQKGTSELLKLQPGAYRDPRVSPDGKQVAVGTDDGREANVWVYELAGTSAVRRLTFGGMNRHPLWSPDGRRIAFQSDRKGAAAIFWQLADGRGTAERLTTPEPGVAHVPESWTPDGKRLWFSAAKGTSVSSMVLSLDDRKSAPFGNVQSTWPINASMSPDGKWLAYMSTSGGSDGSKIYVQPFPPSGATFQITKTTGHHPFWSRDGQELYYIPGATQFALVRVTTRPTFSFSEPIPLSRGPLGFTEGGPGNTRQNDAALDKRVIAVVIPDQAQGNWTAANAPRFNVVLNWLEELKARAPIE